MEVSSFLSLQASTEDLRISEQSYRSLLARLYPNIQLDSKLVST